MTSTMITLAEAAGTTVAAVVAAPVDPGAAGAGILSTIQGLFQDGTAVAKIGINFLVLAIGGYAIAKAKMAAATVVTVVAIGAVIMWWANTGLGSTSDKIGKDLGAPAPTRLIEPSTHLQTDPGLGPRSSTVSPTTPPQVA